MPDTSLADVRPEYPFAERWDLACRRYKKTINTFARNFVNQIPGSEIQDIEQELLMILWKCVKNYNPDRGASFNTLFQGSAKNRCISLVRHENTMGRKGATSSLADEAVERAVDDLFQSCSAEDRVMDRLELQEYVSEHGIDVFFEKPKPGRKKAVA